MEKQKTLAFRQGFLACGIFFFPFLPPFIAAFRARPFIQMFVFAPVYFPLLSPFRSHVCFIPFSSCFLFYEVYSLREHSNPLTSFVEG
jgi:hypothetical protein